MSRSPRSRFMTVSKQIWQRKHSRLPKKKHGEFTNTFAGNNRPFFPIQSTCINEERRNINTCRSWCFVSSFTRPSSREQNLKKGVWLSFQQRCLVEFLVVGRRQNSRQWSLLQRATSSTKNQFLLEIGTRLSVCLSYPLLSMLSLATRFVKISSA